MQRRKTVNHTRAHGKNPFFLKRGSCLTRVLLPRTALQFSALPLTALLLSALLFAACSFDYGEASDDEKNKPDIVMDNLEYVRVRGGDPLARFKAEHAERWEDRQIMEIRDFFFEQLDNGGQEINAEGRAGTATVQIGSGDISLKGGVRINIESEDIIITTGGLEWKDKDKLLIGAEEDEVFVERPDGTSFTGRGFSADIRRRGWTFLGEVKGTYVEKEDEEGDGEEDDKGDEDKQGELYKPAETSTEKTVKAETAEKPIVVFEVPQDK